jgi:hypothetical protein
METLRTETLRRIGALALSVSGLVLLGLMPMTSAQDQSPEPIPAFHDKAPAGLIPATMDPAEFPQPVAQNAYATAARIKKTLYQEPCYCHCDRSQGHGSLEDCFASRHGAECNLCMAEVFYTSEQLKHGKSAAQIREGIIRGAWRKVDLNKYNQPKPAKSAQ